MYNGTKKYRPLCERQNIIISHSNNSELIDNEDILCFKSPHDCIEFIVFNEKNYDEFWIIGGESIYKEFLLNYQEYIDEIHLSKLSSSFMCDQFIEIPFENYEMIHEVKYDEYDYLIYKSK